MVHCRTFHRKGVFQWIIHSNEFMSYGTRDKNWNPKSAAHLFCFNWQYFVTTCENLSHKTRSTTWSICVLNLLFKLGHHEAGSDVSAAVYFTADLVVAKPKWPLYHTVMVEGRLARLFVKASKWNRQTQSVLWCFVLLITCHRGLNRKSPAFDRWCALISNHGFISTVLITYLPTYTLMLTDLW